MLVPLGPLACSVVFGCVCFCACLCPVGLLGALSLCAAVQACVVCLMLLHTCSLACLSVSGQAVGQFQAVLVLIRTSPCGGLKSLQEFAVRPQGAECGCPGACENAETLTVRRVRLFCPPTSRIAVRCRAKPAPSISLLPGMAGCPRRLGAMRTPSLLLLCLCAGVAGARPRRLRGVHPCLAQPLSRGPARTRPRPHIIAGSGRGRWAVLLEFGDAFLVRLSPKL